MIISNRCSIGLEIKKFHQICDNAKCMLHTWQNIQHVRIPRETDWTLVCVAEVLEQN